MIRITTLATVGVEVSPHLFRTSGASTAATRGGDNPLSRQRASAPYPSQRHQRPLQPSNKPDAPRTDFGKSFDSMRKNDWTVTRRQTLGSVNQVLMPNDVRRSSGCVGDMDAPRQRAGGG